MSADPLQPEPASIPPQPPPPLLGPNSEDPKVLGFKRQKMVDWLAPGQLIQTGIKAVVSDIFGAYADKRDVMAALYPKSEITGDYSDRRRAVDRLRRRPRRRLRLHLYDGLAAGQKQLAVRRRGADAAAPRGDLLVMGGDQVYPTASSTEYSNRLLKPYAAALPTCPRGKRRTCTPSPATTTGTTGCRASCRSSAREWIGGWQTRQRRSYFASSCRTTGGSAGSTSSSTATSTTPQLRYFYEIGRGADRTATGSSSARPSRAGSMA